MMNRIGWLTAIVAVAMLFSSKEATPKPADVPPPNPSVDVAPKPTPAPAPTPKIDNELLDRLMAIVSKLDIKSLQTLVDKFESVDMKRIESLIALLNKYGEQAAAAEQARQADAQTPAKGATTVCGCNGNDRNGCLCLKAGVKCHCTAGVGSVWQKTLQKASTSTVAAKPVTSAPSATSLVTDGIPVRQNGNWLYWSVGGTEWHNGGTGIHEGQVYGGRFTYRNGSMFDGVMRSPSQPAVGTKRGGYWKTVCHGSYCTREWVAADH